MFLHFKIIFFLRDYRVVLYEEIITYDKQLHAHTKGMMMMMSLVMMRMMMMLMILMTMTMSFDADECNDEYVYDEHYDKYEEYGYDEDDDNSDEIMLAIMVSMLIELLLLF